MPSIKTISKSSPPLAQVRMHVRNVPRNQKHADELFQRWLSGKSDENLFELIVWRKGRKINLYGVNRNGVKVRASLGTMGRVKEYARKDTTFVDIDTPRCPTLNRVRRVSRRLNIRPVFVRYDRTAKGWHIVTRWNRNFSNLELVALQAVLGSDWKREVFNLARVLSGKAERTNRWNILFERKI
jgi:hypothetical protein